MEDAAKGDGKSVTDWTRDTVLAQAAQVAKKRSPVRTPPPPVIQEKAPPRPRAVTKSGIYKKADFKKKSDLPEDLMVSEEELDAVIEAAARRIETKSKLSKKEEGPPPVVEEEVEDEAPRLLLSGYAHSGVFTKM